MGRLRLLLCALPLVVAACASNAPVQPNEPPPARAVRILTSEGGEQTLVTTDPPGRSTGKPSPLVAPPTFTRTVTPTITPTGTVTPTVTRTRATSTATITPTTTPTPRAGPDLTRMAQQFGKVERYRAQLTGPAILTQEVVPERYRVLIGGAQPAELIVQDEEVFLRRGSFWQRLDDPPLDFTARLDRGIPALEQMARLKHQFRLKGTVRARAGRCLSWDVVDALPREPITICQGELDDLPYRVELPGGTTVEYYDFDQPIVVPEPYPILGE